MEPKTPAGLQPGPKVKALGTRVEHGVVRAYARAGYSRFLAGSVGVLGRCLRLS